MINTRLELYRQGGGLIVATIYCKAGRRAFVIDPDRRAKAAARALLRAGVRDIDAAHKIGRTLDFVRRVLAEMPGGKNWI
jgi:hypothetical protein